MDGMKTRSTKSKGKGRGRGRGRGRKSTKHQSWWESSGDQFPSGVDESQTNTNYQTGGPVTQPPPKVSSFHQEIYDLWSNPKEILSSPIDYQINAMFESFFQSTNMPAPVILAAKRSLMEQLTKLMSTVIGRHVMTDNKSICVHLCEVLKIVETFGDQYKGKVARTLMVEALEAKNNKSKGMLDKDIG